jgi:hypothetical protein
MSKYWRRILTAKALALSAVLVGALVATALLRRRRSDARSRLEAVTPAAGLNP